MNEIFKDVNGYEGLYKVSNTGKVLGVKRNKILKPNFDKDGYLKLSLFKNCKRKDYRIHRLVADAFLENDNGYVEINHKDEDKTNNLVWVNEDGTIDENKSNLMWITHIDNCNWGTRNERLKKKGC